MGTTLTGTKPKDTYDSLIKVTDNGPISGTAKYLSDGLGNDLPIAVSTSNVGIGTAAPTGKLNVLGAGTTAISISNSTAGTSGAKQLTQLNFLGLNQESRARVEATDEAASANGSNLIFYTANTSNTLTEVGRWLPTGGLTFNGDTAAANALDDYEEGTWTMGVTFGGASVGVTYSNNTGTYTKIGRQVTVNGYIGLSNKGSSTGTAKITGLPFTIANVLGSYASASVWLNKVSFVGQFSSIGAINTTSLELWDTSSLGVITALTNSNFANDSEVIISFTYFV